MFTKELKRSGNLDLDEAGDLLVDVGFEGADLTVREGGYVHPDEVETRLPEAVELLESKGLEVPMITTRVTDDDERAEAALRTASECGIDHLKLGYWNYEGFGHFRAGLDEFRRDLDRVYRLSREYPVTPSVHVHSGDHITGSPMAIWDALHGFDPDLLGAYLDPGHMTLEGGRSGWKMGMDALSEYSNIVAVKNFAWVREETGGDVEWRWEKTSLEDGIVPYPEVVEYLDAMEFDGPISLHSEYTDRSFDELVEQTRADLAYFRGLLE